MKRELLRLLDPSRQMRLGIKAFLGIDRVARAWTIFSDDVFLVSYPKSGNTWVRFLIANLVFPGDSIDFKNIEQKIPIIRTPDYKLRRIPRPRILKSHQYFNAEYPKVILIVRDPRDVAVSYYHYSLKIGQIERSCSIEDFVERFVAGTLDRHGSWGENVGSWLGAREGNPGFLMARYEDLLADAGAVLHRIASFLGVSANAAYVNRAVEMSSAEHMRRLEQEQFSVLHRDMKGRKDKPFVRSAKSGSWREELSAQSVACIEAAWPQLMTKLGYLV